MKKTSCRISRALLCVALSLIVTVMFTSPAFAQTKAQKSSQAKWKAAYIKVIKSPRKSIRKIIGDDSYYKSYFGSSYKLTKYFLYDTNKDGTPEMFLVLPKTYSDGQAMAYVLTYHKGKVRVMEFTHVIGFRKGYVLEKGHWHGAGAYSREWNGCKLSYHKGYSLLEFSTGQTYSNSKKVYCSKSRSGFWGQDKYKTLYEKYITKSHYRKFYKKYVKGYKKFSKYYKHAASVKNSRPIRNYKK